MRKHESGKNNRNFLDLKVLTSAVAQEARTSGTEQTFTTKVINVWPGVAPGSEQWKQQEIVLGSGNNRTGSHRLHGIFRRWDDHSLHGPPARCAP